ncbi:MAG: tRNA lysidine(34) synthetase TilS [Acidobacteria bacterium]|nr:tRNA lysidine(34) synthetase TilS [Acidobacteriota bacterium]
MAETLPDRFARHLAETGLLERADVLAVACSGGGDSTALLLLVHGWALPLGIPVVALHVAHGLRGEAGLADARFCAELAARLGVPYGFLSVDVPAQKKKGESVESAARRLRYRALLSVAGEMEAAVLTGHTRDDQAETVLLHLERRLGRGRGGIRASRPDGVVRPLLPFSRSELRAYLEGRGVPWREDETNANEGFARNRVRRTVLPGLERRMPGATQRLARAGEAYSERLDALDRRVDRMLGEEKISLKGNWPRSFFTRLTDGEAARLLLRAAGAIGAGRPPGRKQIEKVLLRLRRDPVFHETFAGHRLTASPRFVRLSPSKKSP